MSASDQASSDASRWRSPTSWMRSARRRPSGVSETSATRAQFRKDCRQAFQDMVKAGGLKTFRIEVTGTGLKKGRRYHYAHALPRQIELNLKPA